ncbi:nitrate/nitrite transporter [Streptomyces venezuelae]|uniref:nitrate/nitrite transporter n=1 Tax=Streptomyces venezuelae TaxID=54571 RepID=UPI00332AD980
MAERTATRRGWIEKWDPEDERFWESTGKRLAHRNLLLSVVSEHVGFSIWSMWSVLVLFLSEDIGLGFSAEQKFLLIVVPTLVGGLLRLPYSYAVTRFGGRDWTVFSAAILLVPTGGAAYVVQRPGTPFWVFLLIAATAGVGGGNFASSMTNITIFFPQRHQGWALGLNAGGGNLGVAAVQLLGLLVISTVGNTHPAWVVGAYLPVIALVALFAALRMDNVAAVRAAPGALREACAHPHTWLISVLYIGTFGSFIGYGFACGLVLQSQFGSTPLEAMSFTFLGPLLGSVARPLGGWLSDRWGGARVSLVVFLAMAAGTGVIVLASALVSFPLFIAGFTSLFVLSGIGNGSVYKLIPAVFAREADRAVAAGSTPQASLARSRRLSGAALGIAGAVGSLGGVAINLVFRASYSGPDGSGVPAFLSFLGFYALCIVLIRLVYLRREPDAASAPAPVPVRDRAPSRL